MAWSFGGATNNRISTPSSVTMGGTTNTSLICGWYRPTTLTAGKAYWSSGTTHSARIATTTSEISLYTQNATTGGVWTTSGAGIVLDEWRFIAFMMSFLNTGAAAAWRVWVGTNENSPTEVTVTVNTAPAGSFTGGSSILLGQLGSGGTVSYQGEIGDNMMIAQAQATASFGPLATAAYGAITQAEADRVLQRIVQPVWKGERFPDAVWSISQGSYTCIVNAFDAIPALATNAIPSMRLTVQLTGEPGAQASLAGVISKGLARCPRAGSAVFNVTRQLRRR
jgi:hypothetical protein